MNFLALRTAYFNYLPPFLTGGLFCGFTTGLEIKSTGPIHKCENMISYTTYGIVFGMCYPISFPLCAGYTLYKKIKENKYH
jgi:hypothetical protein